MSFLVKFLITDILMTVAAYVSVSTLTPAQKLALETFIADGNAMLLLF